MVYIPQQKILTRLQRYKALNETRLQRALSLMTPEARYCLSIVPILLHYNHINLPSYRQGYIPHGIDLFTLNEEQRRYINSLLLPDAPPLEEPQQHAILGLYAMGSISSVGQSDTSDIDIWVCVKADIPADGMSALQDKCRFITTYIKSQGVDLNLFVTPENRFTTFMPDTLDRENCGSAQNIFLLDEFYRSSIRLCGRYIIWYMISTPEEQSDYDAYVDFLLKGISGIPSERLPKHDISQQQKKKGLSLSNSESVPSSLSNTEKIIPTRSSTSEDSIAHNLRSRRSVATASAFVQGELCSQLSPTDVVPTTDAERHAYGVFSRSDNVLATNLDLLSPDYELGFAVDFYPDPVIEPLENTDKEQNDVKLNLDKQTNKHMLSPERFSAFNKFSTVLSEKPTNVEQITATNYVLVAKQFDIDDIASIPEQVTPAAEPNVDAALAKDSKLDSTVTLAEDSDDSSLSAPIKDLALSLQATSSSSIASNDEAAPSTIKVELGTKFTFEEEALPAAMSVSTTVTMPSLSSEGSLSQEELFRVSTVEALAKVVEIKARSAQQSPSLSSPPSDAFLLSSNIDSTIDENITNSLDIAQKSSKSVSLALNGEEIEPEFVPKAKEAPAKKYGTYEWEGEDEIPHDKEAKQSSRLKIMHTARELIKNSGVRQYVPYLLATNSELSPQKGTPLMQAAIAAAGATSHDTSVSITDHHRLPDTIMVVDQHDSALGSMRGNTHDLHKGMGLTVHLSLPQGNCNSAAEMVDNAADLLRKTKELANSNVSMHLATTTPNKATIVTNITTIISDNSASNSANKKTSEPSLNTAPSFVSNGLFQNNEAVHAYAHAQAHAYMHELPHSKAIVKERHGFIQKQADTPRHMQLLESDEAASYGDGDMNYFAAHNDEVDGMASLGSNTLGLLSSRNVQHGHKTWRVQQQIGIVGLSEGWRKEAEFTADEAEALKNRALGRGTGAAAFDGDDADDDFKIKQIDDKTEGANKVLSLEESIAAAQEDEWEESVAPLQVDEWFDFGTVVKGSPTEYFGSGLWLLYKAIDSPFKVVLKILLMEAYSSDYPNTKLLSSELKDYMHSHDGYSLDLDSYYLMYLKVSNYLQQLHEQSIAHKGESRNRPNAMYLRNGSNLNSLNSLSTTTTLAPMGANQLSAGVESAALMRTGRGLSGHSASSLMVHYDRLQLMRKCFYLKIFNGLNHKDVDYAEDYKLKRELLDKFAMRWGESPSFVKELESIGSWKMQAVNDFNQEVYNTILESYMSLLRFSVRHGIEYAITSDDAGILSRKLYAAFDRYPSKIPVLHSSFKHNLEESYLTFIHPSEYSLCRKGWHLYTAAPNDVALLSTKVSYIGSRLSEVVTWACFNRLMTPRSRTFVVGSASKEISPKIKQLSRDIQRVLGPYLGGTNVQDLQEAQQMQSCVVVLNLEQDDTDLLRNNLMDIGSSSTLCFGRQRICWVGSVDLIFINNWGEIRSMSFPDGEEGVVELLATLLRMFSNNTAVSENVSALLSKIEVCSYAYYYQDLIKYDLESIMRQVFNCLNKGSSSEFVFEVGRNNYIARARGERGVMIQRDGGFGSNEFDISVLSRYGMRPEFALQVPPIVDRYASAGIVQYFFVPKKKHEHWDIYILNERNEVRIYKDYFGSRATLVNAINRFYTSQSQSRALNAIRFNLPQYFVLSDDQKTLHPFTIKSMS